MHFQRKNLIRAGALFVTVPFLAAGFCDGNTGLETPLSYTLDWRFENNYCYPVEFTFTDEDQEDETLVGSGLVQNVQTTGLFTDDSTQVAIHAHAPGRSVDSGDAKRVSVAPGKTTTLMVVMSEEGNVSINATGPASSSLVTAPACVTNWLLEAPVGALTGNFSDNGATGTGTLTLNMPQSVQTGQTVTVGATFTASVTKRPGFVGPETLSMTFSGGLSPTPINATTNLGTATLANPTLSGAVTASFSWTVPAAGPGNRLPFQINTGFGNGHGVGWGLLVTVAYAKVP